MLSIPVTDVSRCYHETALGASAMFYVPGAREICLWMQAVDASKCVVRLGVAFAAVRDSSQ